MSMTTNEQMNTRFNTMTPRRCCFLLLTMFLAGVTATEAASSTENEPVSSERDLRGKIVCQVLEVNEVQPDPDEDDAEDIDTTESLTNSGESEWHCVPDAAEENGIKNIHYVLEGLDEAFVRGNRNKMSKGKSWIAIPGGTKSKGPNGDKINVPRRSQLEFVDKPNNGNSGGGNSGNGNGNSGNRNSRNPGGQDPGNRNLADRALVSGTRSVLILRVTDSAGVSTTYNRFQLGYSVFGPDDKDPVTLKSQLAACSYGKVQITKAAGTNISRGVAEITIDIAVAGQNRVTVMNKVTEKAEQKLGPGVLESFDHVMYCLPPGTSGGAWMAFSTANHWKQVYNDMNCDYISVQMFEFGYNLGLKASGENYNYDDTSCLMGYSNRESDRPIQCYNALKSSELAWYSDREITIDPTEGSYGGKLVGLADYQHPNLTPEHTVILKIVESNSSDDLYAMLMRKKDMMAHVREFEDQVAVYEGKYGDKSKARASLIGGEEYRKNNFNGGGYPLVVEVCDFSWVGSLYVAQVSVYIDYGTGNLSLCQCSG